MKQAPTGHFALSRNAMGRLVHVGADGTVHEGIVPVRAFALTLQEGAVALMSADSKELQWIERLADLPENERHLIEEELARRDFIPVIRRIVTISSYATPSTWQVETDRGDTELILKSEDDIRRLKEPGALLIADSQGLHYLVRDRRQLDSHSQKILKRFL